MAATMWIEVESGTECAPVHPHNGYWAGDFLRPALTEETDGGCARG
jgi:hypothetical protein